MKQTAVELLERRIMNTSITSNGQMIFYHEELKRWLDEAKEMERDQKIAFGKRCFYEGFEKAENDDANCFTAWRESVDKLLTFKSE